MRQEIAGWKGPKAAAARDFFAVNFGPWDRLDGNAPFVQGVGPKPEGAGFYPRDMTKEEFEAAAAKSPTLGKVLRSQYTVVRRDTAGGLIAIPYHVAFADQIAPAVAKLREAGALAEDAGLRRYLSSVPRRWRPTSISRATSSGWT